MNEHQSDPIEREKTPGNDADVGTVESSEAWQNFSLSGGMSLAFAFHVIVVLVTLFFPTYTGATEDYVSIVGMGIAFSQVGLLGLWCTLASASRSSRFVTAVVGMFLSCSYLVLVMQRVGGEAEAGRLFSTVLIAQYLLLSAFLGALGWIARWQIGIEMPTDTLTNDVQFGLKQMLVWVTCFAVLMGVGRLLALVIDLSFLEMIRVPQLITLGAIAVANMFNCSIIGLAVLVRRHLISALLFGAMAVVIVCTLEILIVVYSVTMISDHFPLFISLAHFTNVVCLAVTLMFLRMSGLRLWIRN